MAPGTLELSTLSSPSRAQQRQPLKYLLAGKSDLRFLQASGADEDLEHGVPEPSECFRQQLQPQAGHFEDARTAYGLGQLADGAGGRYDRGEPP
jgi:hypothetical protein